MQEKVIPFGHRVLIKPNPVETKTASGIIITTNERRETAATERGTVVLVGDTFG